MANDNFNLLEWYAAHRDETALLHDPSVLFALGFLDSVGPMSRAALQQDLGADAAALDRSVDALYHAGFISTQGNTLAVTPRGQQFLTELGLRGPIPPPTTQGNKPPQPEPPPAPPSVATASAPKAAGTPIWLYAVIGILIVGAIVIFGAVSGIGRQPTPTTTRIAVQPTFTVISGGKVTQTPLPPTTALDPVVEFVAKPTSVRQGQCAELAWQVTNAQQASLNDRTVELRGAQRVCPKETTKYLLVVQPLSGQAQTFTQVVGVTPRGKDYIWTINLKNLPNSDERIAQALAFATDKQAIAKSNLDGQGTFTNEDAKLDAIPYSPGRAQVLLKQANYDGQLILISAADDISRQLANALAKYLSAVNLNVKVVNQPDSQVTISVTPKP